MSLPFPENALFFLAKICLKELADAVIELCSNEVSPRKGGILAIVVIDPEHQSPSSSASLSVGDPTKRIVWHCKNVHEKIENINSDLRTGLINTLVGFNKDGYEVYTCFSGTHSREIDGAIGYVIGEKLELKMPVYENPFLARVRELLENVITED